MELKGKTVNFLGDSITEGVGVEDQTKRYDVRLSERWELKKANNYGISGTRFAHQHVPYDPASFDLNFCGRSLYMDKEADLIIVFGATNDFGHGDAAFGSDGQTTPATYCGAVSRRPSGLRKTNVLANSLAHRTTWLRSDLVAGVVCPSEPKAASPWPKSLVAPKTIIRSASLSI